jgi:hypothetical protein
MALYELVQVGMHSTALFSLSAPFTLKCTYNTNVIPMQIHASSLLFQPMIVCDDC